MQIEYIAELEDLILQWSTEDRNLQQLLKYAGLNYIG